MRKENHCLITTGATPVGSVWATMGAIAGEHFPKEILKDLGKKLVSALKETAVLPEVEEMRESIQREWGT